jgi:DNA-binding NarL/FixJ family response regulator
MAEGLTNQGIADRLVVTEKAVERHVTSIFSKLLIDAAPDEHRRVLAVLSFLRAG